jgi:hypothetical protein
MYRLILLLLSVGLLAAQDRAGRMLRDILIFDAHIVTGCGLRTPQYTYAVMAPKQPGWRSVSAAEKYVEYILYDSYADPRSR